MKTRAEHLQWCKDEALKVLSKPRAKLSDALMSIFHNLEEHDGTKAHPKMGEIYFHMCHPEQLDTLAKMKKYLNELT